MSAPIYDKLLKYRREDIYPFHMPGHKGGRGIPQWDIFNIDITEIPGFDNLMAPDGIILQAEEKAAHLWGAKKTLFSVNGSSGSLIAAISAVCGEGERIIVARNCHESVYSALVFSGCMPYYVYPKEVEKTDIVGGITAESIEEALKANTEARAVVITSPSAEGICSDVGAIAEIVHRKNIPLIVDEAHGAHFMFSDCFPKNALSQGADVVVQSMHKTLNAPTQTSLIHIGSDMVDAKRIEKTLSMLQTSSPSYIFMAFMDKCRDELEQNGFEKYKVFTDKIKSYRHEFKNLKGMSLFDESFIGKSGISAIDISKFTVITKNLSGTQAAGELEKRKIMLEMSCPGHFTAITTPSDTDEGFERLMCALSQIDKINGKNALLDRILPYPKAETVCSLRTAFYKKSIETDFDSSAGRVSAEFAIPYPPGIPVIAPGERINRQMIDVLREYAKNGVEIVGLEHSGLEKIKVLR